MGMEYYILCNDCKVYIDIHKWDFSRRGMEFEEWIEADYPITKAIDKWEHWEQKARLFCFEHKDHSLEEIYEGYYDWLYDEPEDQPYKLLMCEHPTVRDSRCVLCGTLHLPESK